MKVAAAVSKAYAAVQWVLNTALTANPIGLVVVAIAALVAALVIAWKRSDKFREIVTGAWEKIKSATARVFEAVKSAIGRAWDFITGIFFNFTGPGLVIKHWDKIKTTVSNGVGRVVDFVKGLPGRILDALKDAGSLLLDIGSQIMQGLWDGLKAKWEDVKGWFGGVTDLIPDLKGPASRDRKLLTNAGRLIMGGFQDGLEQGAKGPLGFLDSLTTKVGASLDVRAPRISPDLARAAAGGTTIVNVTVEAPVGSSPAEIGRELVRCIDSFVAAGGRQVAR